LCSSKDGTGIVLGLRRGHLDHDGSAQGAVTVDEQPGVGGVESDHVALTDRPAVDLEQVAVGVDFGLVMQHELMSAGQS
jgi:hypothetical protein